MFALAEEADALRQALADAGRIGAVDGSLMLAQVGPALMA